MNSPFEPGTPAMPASLRTMKHYRREIKQLVYGAIAD
jgi:hypothetical protein